MLAEYYDAANKEQDQIFKHMDIMKQKLTTDEMGKYLVLHLKFDSVSPCGDVRAAFHEYINTSVQQFSNKYVQAGLLNMPVEIDPSNALNSLRHLFSALRLSPHRIYLIVDDADAFITPLLFTIDNHNQRDLGYAQYQQVMEEKYTLLRDWGNVIKDGYKGLAIARAFFTGTLPFRTVDFGNDLSDIHMVKYLLFSQQLKGLFGCTSEDVLRGLQTAQPALTQAQQLEHLEHMQRYYGGYRFHRDQQEAVFDPQSVLYYLGHLAQTGQPPSDPVDPALLRDNHEAAQFLVNNHTARGPYTLQNFVLGHAPAKEMRRFENMAEPEFRSRDLFLYRVKKYEALVSFAYYQGFLTHTYDKEQQSYTTLASPNLSTQTVLLRQLFSALPGAQTSQLEAWLRSSVKPDVNEFKRMVRVAMEEGSKTTGRDLVSELGAKLTQVTGRVYM